jgi:hypothetical protein
MRPRQATSGSGAARFAILFLFTTFDGLRATTPLPVDWGDATGGGVNLI